MIKDCWINLPVKDIAVSKTFFEAIGFTLHPRHDGANGMLTVLMGKNNFPVMLFAETMFAGFAHQTIADTKTGSEVLISFEVETRADVDTFAEKVTAAGGIVFGKPGESQGWMYGMGFSDPDGHRWNALYMDWEKMPK
jgi:predicted lactoylglutathione lyase